MAKKNKRRAQGEPRTAVGTGVSVQWVVVALLVGLVFGGVTGYVIGGAVSSSGGASAITDAYGRSPGHPHYNHDHR